MVRRAEIDIRQRPRSCWKARSALKTSYATYEAVIFQLNQAMSLTYVFDISSEIASQAVESRLGADDLDWKASAVACPERLEVERLSFTIQCFRAWQ